MIKRWDHLKEGGTLRGKIAAVALLILFLAASCFPGDSTVSHLSGRETPSLGFKKEVSADFIPRVYKVVAIGDSLTKGVGSSTKKDGYISFLRDLLEKEKGIKEAVISNFAVSGNRTFQLLSQLKEEEIQQAIRDADMVLMTIGGNDLMHVVRENFSGLMLEHFAREKEEYEKNFSALIRAIRKINDKAAICMIGLYNPYHEYFSHIEEIDIIISEWNEASKRILEQHPNTFFVDISQTFEKHGDELLHEKDYFHPNDKGYKIIAEHVYSVLKERPLDGGRGHFASDGEEQAENEK